MEGNLTDVWGSAFAASLDGIHTMLGGSNAWPADAPPPCNTSATPADRLLPQHGIFAAGQVRHLPAEESWIQSYCVPKGSEPGGPTCAKGFNYDPGGIRMAVSGQRLCTTCGLCSTVTLRLGRSRVIYCVIL
jgi:hypothetical protein